MYICNEWKNLVCRYTVNTCQCFDEFYYYNNTMCVLGKFYGQTCTSNAMCVPSTAGFVCSSPYVGTTNTVCRCASGTQYYDTITKLCTSLKSFNVTCRDNSECLGSSAGSMYCGYGIEGSASRCLCTDAYYSNGTTCVSRLIYGTSCTSTIQCNSYLNQTCLANTNKCGCASGLYYNSADATCQQLKYTSDSCVLGIECWSGSCTNLKCV